MTSFTSLLVAGLFAAGSLAAPSHNLAPRQSSSCISDTDAQQVATGYGNLIQLISGWEDIADSLLTTDFTDYSESVNTLIDSCPTGSDAESEVVPLLGASFTSRAAFISGQGQQASINFNQLNIWHSCDTVVFRWESTNTADIPNVRPVVGIISAEVTPAPSGNEYPYQISTVYSEFDAGAWLQNLNDAGICVGGIDPASSYGTNSTSSAGAGGSSSSSSTSSATATVLVVTETITATANFGAGPTPFTWTTTMTESPGAPTTATSSSQAGASYITETITATADFGAGPTPFTWTTTVAVPTK
ncbi:hypothetical protein EJ03DRAFT_153050 [Teratosphaeria nubilosa]|uniref:NTF2-like domain-containing protein n=1 Tax=Teratosphaeria nubilosa TaxID=161662 RepID=A0A6G1LJJ1_9PEZI|nr:hypothetical protein EJ03DRAFT_153050 [Teratosphaeria nubilosa]